MSKLGLVMIRRRAGVTQNEAAVRAKVGPPLCRNFERFGHAAVVDEEKLARLVAVYEEFRRVVEQRDKERMR